MKNPWSIFVIGELSIPSYYGARRLISKLHMTHMTTSMTHVFFVLIICHRLTIPKVKPSGHLLSASRKRPLVRIIVTSLEKVFGRDYIRQ